MNDDASMDDGTRFMIGPRRMGGGLFGFSDVPPKVVGESMTRDHVAARKRWPVGEVGVQIGWSHHGRVRIVELSGGNQIALWIDEAMPLPPVPSKDFSISDHAATRTD